MGAGTTDELFIEAPSRAVYEALVDPGSGWWPGARATVREGRLTASAPGFHRFASRVRFEARVEGLRPGEGLTWRLERGELRGRAEWWLEGFKNGTIVHYYLDVDPGDRGRLRRWPSRLRRHRWAVRRGMNALKDRLEASAARR
ncbi:MAG: hypothetical protein HY775_07385 [Acidobacteria bacterium]|nr:hypothetical protein [Acidobacteriota bacterium]